jgi:hypothetical protein
MTILSSFSLRSLTSAALFSAIGVASVALAAPANAASVDFNAAPWSQTGNIFGVSPGAATLSTADPATDALAPDLQTFLGITPTALDINQNNEAYEGAALKTTVAVGDTLSFKWVAALETGEPDYAFVIIPGIGKVDFTGTEGIFNTTFTTAGLFGIGIVDVGSGDGDSTLSIFESNLTPVPTPALLPGLIGFGYSLWRKRVDA